MSNQPATPVDPSQWEAELQRSGRVVVPLARTLRSVAIGLTIVALALSLGAAIILPIVWGPLALLVVTGPMIMVAALATVVLVMQLRFLKRDLVVTAAGIQIGRDAPVPWHEITAVTSHRGVLRFHVVRSGRPETLRLGELQAASEQVVAWLQPKVPVS